MVMAKHYFSVIITQDEGGMYLAQVPELPGCHTQAKTLPVLYKRIEEAMELCVEVAKLKKKSISREKFIGVQQMELTA